MCEQLLSRYSASQGVQNNKKAPEKCLTGRLECLVLDDSGNSQFTDSMLWAKVQEEVRLFGIENVSFPFLNWMLICQLRYGQ